MKTYDFYGWERANVLPINPKYQKVGTPRDLYDLLSNIWCRYSCSSRMRPTWSEDNKTLGQCTITSFLVQDIYGGKVYGIDFGGGAVHCYNDVNGCVFDLTSEQFGGKPLVYENNPEQDRESKLGIADNRERYSYLVAALDKALGIE